MGTLMCGASGVLESLCYTGVPSTFDLSPEAQRSFRLQKEEKISGAELLFTWRCHWHIGIANGRAASCTKMQLLQPVSSRFTGVTSGTESWHDLGERVLKLFEKAWVQDVLHLAHQHFMIFRSANAWWNGSPIKASTEWQDLCTHPWFWEVWSSGHDIHRLQMVALYRYIYIFIRTPSSTESMPGSLILCKSQVAQPFWLVVWNMNVIFPFSWECHHPNWL